MHRHASTERVSLATSYTDHAGKKRFFGNAATKRSQKYPEQFGNAIAAIYRAHDDELKQEATKIHQEVANMALKGRSSDVLKVIMAGFPKHKTGWCDAQLREVLEYMAQ